MYLSEPSYQSSGWFDGSQFFSTACQLSTIVTDPAAGVFYRDGEEKPTVVADVVP